MDLGFAEECKESWRLRSQYFPSKLGGSPAWLALKQLPNFDDLKCTGCSKTCTFLLQLYAPGGDDDCGSSTASSNTAPNSGDGSCDEDDEDDSQTFHRTIFLFVCAKGTCTNRSVKCFRSQLPRKNNFYDFDPPNYYDDDEQTKWSDSCDDEVIVPKKSINTTMSTTTAAVLSPTTTTTTMLQAGCMSGNSHHCKGSISKICYVCHCEATKCCSQCKEYFYCSKDHQSLHWKSGHKIQCSGTDKLQCSVEGRLQLISL